MGETKVYLVIRAELGKETGLQERLLKRLKQHVRVLER